MRWTETKKLVSLNTKSEEDFFQMKHKNSTLKQTLKLRYNVVINVGKTSEFEEL